jgi:hypothetical protein
MAILRDVIKSYVNFLWSGVSQHLTGLLIQRFSPKVRSPNYRWKWRIAEDILESVQVTEIPAIGCRTKPDVPGPNKTKALIDKKRSR